MRSGSSAGSMNVLITGAPPAEFMRLLPEQKNPALHGTHAEEDPSWMPCLREFSPFKQSGEHELQALALACIHFSSVVTECTSSYCI
jgi:hypothetical protein